MLVLACSAAADPTTAPPATTSPPTTVADPGPTTAPTEGDGVTVSAGDFSFGPSTVTISVGESVTWTLSEGAHTTTSGTSPDPDGLWNEAVTADAPFTFTFEEAGTFPYFCRFHPDFMTGEVIVEP